MRIPVLLHAWDIDCCLALPSVGDPVAWSLIWWAGEPDDPAAVEVPWTTQPLRLTPEESDHIGVASGHQLTYGPVSAWWRGADEQSLPRRGVLEADQHGFVPAGVPATQGRALEVSLVIRTRRKAGRHQWEENPDGTSVWPVADTGAWDDWEQYAALAGPLSPGQDRYPDGVLVVVDAGSAPARRGQRP